MDFSLLSQLEFFVDPKNGDGRNNKSPAITGVTNELTEKIEKIPIKEQKKIIKVIHTLLEE